MTRYLVLRTSVGVDRLLTVRLQSRPHICHIPSYNVRIVSVFHFGFQELTDWLLNYYHYCAFQLAKGLVRQVLTLSHRRPADVRERWVRSASQGPGADDLITSDRFESIMVPLLANLGDGYDSSAVPGAPRSAPSP